MLAGTLVVYLAVLLALDGWAQRRTRGEADFLAHAFHEDVWGTGAFRGAAIHLAPYLTSTAVAFAVSRPGREGYGRGGSPRPS
ncbi:MAG TPA: hypothetical protein RMH99_28130 [Sandaracinaceae bacterium LLY-WYZ-13_1]|nr:hypothetical protein [Sandaracinaceae bacterium LLY-WYZ-13_1]